MPVLFWEVTVEISSMLRYWCASLSPAGFLPKNPRSTDMVKDSIGACVCRWWRLWIQIQDLWKSRCERNYRELLFGISSSTTSMAHITAIAMSLSFVTSKFLSREVASNSPRTCGSFLSVSLRMIHRLGTFHPRNCILTCARFRIHLGGEVNGFIYEYRGRLYKTYCFSPYWDSAHTGTSLSDPFTSWLIMDTFSSRTRLTSPSSNGFQIFGEPFGSEISFSSFGRSTLNLQ